MKEKINKKQKQSICCAGMISTKELFYCHCVQNRKGNKEVRKEGRKGVCDSAVLGKIDINGG